MPITFDQVTRLAVLRARQMQHARNAQKNLNTFTDARARDMAAHTMRAAVRDARRFNWRLIAAVRQWNKQAAAIYANTGRIVVNIGRSTYPQRDPLRAWYDTSAELR